MLTDLIPTRQHTMPAVRFASPGQADATYQPGAVSASAEEPGGTITAETASRFFRWLCVGHVLVWTLLPALLYHNEPADSLEGLAWGRMWLFGYDKHPFLAPWLTALFSDLFGTVGWPIYLLGQLSVVTCFWAVRRIALPIVGPVGALLAVVVLEGVYYYNISAITFNPNVAMLATWALATWAFREALQRPGLFRWVRAGLFAGLATLAKYESAILFVVMLFALFALPEGRRAMRGKSFLAGIAAAVLVASPNLWWLITHDFAPFHYAMDSMNLAQGSLQPGNHALAQARHPYYAPLWFLLEQIAALLPMLLLYVPFVRWRDRNFSLGSFDRRFILIMAVGPILVTELFAVTADIKLVARWGYSFFSLAGLALVLFFPPQLSAARWRRFGGLGLALLLVQVCGVCWSILVNPWLSGKPPYTTAAPRHEEAEFMHTWWYERQPGPLKYIAGDRWVISGMTAYSDEKPTPYFEVSDAQSPWMNEADLRRDGGVLVHKLTGDGDRDDVISAIRHRFPGLEAETVTAFAHDTRAPVPPERLWIAILPPAAGRP